jgi:hypothetical protein
VRAEFTGDKDRRRPEDSSTVKERLLSTRVERSLPVAAQNDSAGVRTSGGGFEWVVAVGMGGGGFEWVVAVGTAVVEWNGWSRLGSAEP